MKSPGQNMGAVEATPVVAIETGAEKPKEGVTAKGQERYDNLGKSIDGAKNKVKGWISSGKNAMGRMFKGAVVGVLSAPEVAKATGTAVVEGAVRVGDAIEGKLSDASYALDAAGDFINDKIEDIKDLGVEKYNQAKAFAGQKAEQMQNLVTEGALLAGALASLAQNKTMEGLATVKESVKTRWSKLLEFGKSTIRSAEIAKQEALLNYKSQMNERKQKSLETRVAKNEADKEKVQKLARKIAQLKAFDAALAG